MRPIVNSGHFKHFSFSYKFNPKKSSLNLTYLQFPYSKYANGRFKINFTKKNFSPSRHYVTNFVSLSWDKQMCNRTICVGNYRFKNSVLNGKIVRFNMR
jgi:hypothetical protein